MNSIIICFFSLVLVFKFELLSSSFHCEEEQRSEKAENHLAEGPAAVDDGSIARAAAQVTCRACVHASMHTQTGPTQIIIKMLSYGEFRERRLSDTTHPLEPV